LWVCALLGRFGILISGRALFVLPATNPSPQHMDDEEKKKDEETTTPSDGESSGEAKQ